MAKRAERSEEAQHRRRRVYLSIRVPLLLEELDQVVQETQTIVEKIEDSGDPLGPDERLKLQERLIYLGEHRHTITAEVQALREEQRSWRKDNKSG